MAQCLARHRWHWQQNHSQMSFHWSAGCKLARFLLRGKKKLKERKGESKGTVSGRFRATNAVLTIIRSECLLWRTEQFLSGADLFHLTLVFHKENSAGHLSRTTVSHNRRSRQIEMNLQQVFPPKKCWSQCLKEQSCTHYLTCSAPRRTIPSCQSGPRALPGSIGPESPPL